MARGSGVRDARLRTVVVASALTGVLLGAVAFAVDPLPVRAAPGSGTSLAVPRTTATPSASRNPASSPSPRPSPVATRSPSRLPTPAGPPFTSRALLQTSELLTYGWATASELSLQDGVVRPSLLRCVRPGRLPQQHLAAYAATYQGLHTQATEQVLRYESSADADAAFGRLVDQVGGCGSADADLRVGLGTRHEPEQEGISRTVWWNVRGAATHDPMRGVLALVRVDDRLAVLYLHATVTDPATTTDVLPLMRQAGLRLV